MLSGHASGWWLSELGAGVRYNRENMEVFKIVYYAVKWRVLYLSFGTFCLLNV